VPPPGGVQELPLPPPPGAVAVAQAIGHAFAGAVLQQTLPVPHALFVRLPYGVVPTGQEEPFRQLF